MGPRTQTRTHNHQVRFTHLSLAIALCFAIAILFARPSIAQTFTASIAGTVTDPTGAIVRGAKLQLQNSDTTKDMRQTSGNDGAYTFNSLLPGTYKLSVTAAGFKDYAQTDMVLRANTSAIANVELQVGNTSERVVVDAGGAVLLNTASANNPELWTRRCWNRCPITRCSCAILFLRWQGPPKLRAE